MRKISSFIIFSLAFIFCLSSNAFAVVYIEDFNAPFPQWESGWLGQNSNLQNYYGVGAGRGNNPDGLWISSAEIIFDASFGSTIDSFAIDIAAYVPAGFRVFDMSNTVILDIPSIVLTGGAYTNPGVYAHYSVISNNGVSKFAFIGSDILGNTSIDNVVVSTGGHAPIPEPMTMALFGIGLLGTGYLRKNKGRSA